MDAFNVIFPGCAGLFGFGLGLSLMGGFVAGGLVEVVTYIFSLMGGK